MPRPCPRLASALRDTDAPGARGFIHGLLAATVLASLVFGGCGRQAESTPISREAFLDAYVALRTAELSSTAAVIAEETRDSILTAMGIDHEDMLAFVEVHGDDVGFMETVWSEAQNRMVELIQRGDATR